MAKYFNTSNGPIAVELRNGKSASIPGKTWANIPSEQEGSEDLIRAVRKGFLVRSVVEDDAVSEVSPPAVLEVSSTVETPSKVEDVSSTEKASAEEAPAETEAVGEKISEPRRRRG